MNHSVYSVSELTFLLKQEIEPKFQNIFVKGEVSNLRKQSSGHTYFTLKDESAQISVALFKGALRGLSFTPKEGDLVEIFGQISIYAPRGSYQIIASSVTLQGEGALLKKLQERKEILRKKGWLDPSRKKKLPFLPQKIGVITSPTGAVIQDILHVLHRRFFNISLILNPVKVQGEGASKEIAKAISDLNTHQLVDVIIVGRGGGSIEDLWAFNEEEVVEAIYHSTIPIISAVGHETDFTLSDFVADYRAPTPSAAAEVVVKEKKMLLESLESLSLQLTKKVEQKIATLRQRQKTYQKNSLLSSPYLFLGKWIQKLEEKERFFAHMIPSSIEKMNQSLQEKEKRLFLLGPKNQLALYKQNFTKMQGLWLSFFHSALKRKQEKTASLKAVYKLKKALLQKKEEIKKKFSLLQNHFRDLDPKNLLKKGYTILFSEKEHSIILSCKEAKKGDPFYALVKDGKIHATITRVEPNGNREKPLL